MALTSPLMRNTREPKEAEWVCANAKCAYTTWQPIFIQAVEHRHKNGDSKSLKRTGNVR